MALPSVTERRKGILERIQRCNLQNLIDKWLDKKDEIKISMMILAWSPRGKH